MIVKHQVVNRILYWIVAFCIFSFKLILIGVGESGVRADDFLIAIAFLLLLLRGDLRRIPRSRAFNIYLAFIAINLLSTLWNSVHGRIDLLVSSFFVVRLIQYLVFYYLGYLMARNGIRPLKMLTWYLATLCVVVPLQMLGIIPVPGAFGNITTRAVGNTNGPYELAAVAAFLLCYLGYARKTKIASTLSVFLVLLSASRITSVATLFSLAKVTLNNYRSRSMKVAAYVSIAMVALIGFSILRADSGNSSGSHVGIVGRLSSAASGTSLDTVTAAYDNAPVYKNSSDYFTGAFLSAIDTAIAGDGDASGMIRIFRWATLIKTTLGGYDSILLGLGPSFGSISVDGYFIRVFVETGVIGLVLLLWFVKTLFDPETSSWPFREYILIMIMTACFIDVFVSYKPMLLLWLWHGMHQYRGGKGAHEGSLLHAG